jgi:hypothetical protein
MRQGLWIILVLSCGCQVEKPTPTVLARRPASSQPVATANPVAQSPEEPKLDDSSALRTEFAYGNNKTQVTGTAFAIQSKTGKKYLVSAAHLYKDTEWPTMRKITLRTLAEKQVGECLGRPLYVGKCIEDSPALETLFPDFSEDLMIAEIADNCTAQTLRLATQAPAKGDPVWVVGCETSTPGKQRMYPCSVATVTAKQFAFTPLVPFDPWDFSGGPVVNRRGEVVANLLAGSKVRLIGTSVQAMRERISSLKIELD